MSILYMLRATTTAGVEAIRKEKKIVFTGQIIIYCTAAAL